MLTLDIRAYIKQILLKKAKKTSIEGVINEKTNEINTLIDVAKVYETKPLDMSIYI